MRTNDHSEMYHRCSIRLHGFDCTRQGAYFVTVCTRNRACLFGNVVDGTMQLNGAGGIAEQCWSAIPKHFPHAAFDVFVVMPNHAHGIVWIVDDVRADVGGNVVGANLGAKDFSPLAGTSVFRSPSKKMGSMVRGSKIGVTKWMRANTDCRDVWQRNYYEHIIRDEDALEQILRYVLENPARWAEDAENPTRKSCAAGGPVSKNDWT